MVFRFSDIVASTLGGLCDGSPELSRLWPVVSTSSAVVAIHIGEEESGPLLVGRLVRAVAGRGLEGDRNFYADGADSGKALTLVEEESVEGASLAPGATRRQITVRGIRLNDLVGKRFHVGDVECLAVRPCEPCKHLESMTRPGLIEDLLHRAGINADILSDGTISVGDEVLVVEDDRSAVADRAEVDRHLRGGVVRPLQETEDRMSAIRSSIRRRTFLAIATCSLFAATGGSWGVTATTSAAATPTIVSIEWHDGNRDSIGAVRILTAHAMHATWLVNTDPILAGNPANLTPKQLQRIEATGNEVGGHARSREHPAAARSRKARSEVCTGPEQPPRPWAPCIRRRSRTRSPSFDRGQRGRRPLLQLQRRERDRRPHARRALPRTPCRRPIRTRSGP